MPSVALFSTLFLPYSQTFVYEEIRHHRRYTVEVFCRRRLLADRFPVEPVHVGGPLYGLTCRSARFEDRFRRARFDLVHAHFGVGAVYARGFARRHRLPLVVTFHGYDVPLLRSPARWLPRDLRYAIQGPRVLRDMTLGLCASTELRDLLLAQGVPGDRLAVYRLGVDLQAFRPADRPASPIEVLMVGRLVEKKGFEFGLRAFAQAARSRPDLRLTIIGEGHREPMLRRMARELAVADRVAFAGAVAPGEVANRMARSHLLLAPSVVGRHGNRESGLIVVKEASACGMVPIGAVHGGIPEIIDDGATGFLVAERDVDTMADRLGRLADDPPLARQMGRAARAKMEREYEVGARVAELEEHYDAACARRAAAAGR